MVTKTLPARPLLVLSPDWQIRALLVAQLDEEADRDVVSAPCVDGALSLVRTLGIHPALVIVDVGEEISPGDLQHLMAGLPDTPLLLVGSVLRVDGFGALCERCSACLSRPVSIGRITRVAIGMLDRESIRSSDKQRSAA